MLTKKASSFLFMGFSILGSVLIAILLIFISVKMSTITTEMRAADIESRHALTLRRMLSSSDCLAYEVQNVKTIKVGDEIIPLVGKRVFPNTLDINKIKDFDHINCIRLDMDSPEVYNKIEWFIYDADEKEYLLREYSSGIYDPISTSYSNTYDETCERRNLTYTTPESCKEGYSYVRAFPVSLVDNGDKNFGVVLFRDCYKGDYATIAELGGFR
jgi:hypothetical protein